jgi:hypothetical protein
MPKEKSFVWKYFSRVGGEDSNLKQCQKCPYINKSTSASTSAMAFHLQSKHGITGPPSAEGQTGDSARKIGLLYRQACAVPYHTRSYEEWVTRQVVEDGLTLRQVSGSDFQATACRAMLLKHCKSHGTVGKIVMSFIDGMKEETKHALATKIEKGKFYTVPVPPV